ncbi:hypothetical protein RDI58_028707 [Solanum bulbocastanum]|uniref:Uncharacterized protein n=1 Tax=Solanum bulbocastanum TaxID=147425 RepID=A0AAN8XZ79_SOLBU
MTQSTKLKYVPTEPEMDAALQLIQLSGDSHNDDYFEVNEEESKRGNTPETLIRRRKFRLVVDLYDETEPLSMMKMKKKKKHQHHGGFKIK